MASLEIQIRDRTGSKFAIDVAQTWGRINDGEVFARMGIIQPVGVIPVPTAAVAGTVTQWHAWATTSDFGYRTLINPEDAVAIFVTRTAVFSGTPIPTGEKPIEEYITAIGDMDGVESNGSTVPFQVYARKDPDENEVNKVRMEAYYRTSGGAETLLDSFTTPDLTGSFTAYSGNLTFTQSWATSSRFVIKCVAINDGVPA